MRAKACLDKELSTKFMAKLNPMMKYRAFLGDRKAYG